MEISPLRLISGIICFDFNFAADPTIQDGFKKVAFELAKNKTTKLVFRRFAGSNLEKWKWKEARVEPLTKEMEESQEQKKIAAAAKKKKSQQKKQKENKKKQRIAERNEQMKNLIASIDRKRQKTEKEMPEREKRALAAEMRWKMSSGKLKQCAHCKGWVQLVVPFVYDDENHFCAKGCCEEWIKVNFDKISGKTAEDKGKEEEEDQN